MHKLILVLQGLVETIGTIGFLFGLFDIPWLMITGGVLVVLDDAVEIATGVLNPLFPIILAVSLSLVLTPWYTGIFWASAAFKVIGLPMALKKIFVPGQLIARIQEDPFDANLGMDDR